VLIAFFIRALVSQLNYGVKKNKMGDIKRKRKLFSRPKKLFDRARMDEENVLIKKYGLKNKREIWKAKSTVSKLRRRAKGLIGKSDEEQRAFFEKLCSLGFSIVDISDVLALTEENIFARRLQTFVFRKKLANTIKQARQLIVHKNILVDGKTVNVPSFVVTKNLENKITVREQKMKMPNKEVNKEKIEEAEE
jgi:small subunit ribosomal protein S4